MPDDITFGLPPRVIPGPFTVTKLRGILSVVLKRGRHPGRQDIEQLVKQLNLIWGAFRFAKQVANNAKKNASRVRSAFEVLLLFFEERRQACFPEDAVIAPVADVIETEAHLYGQFQGFMKAFSDHDFRLDMDAGLTMPEIDDWADIAEVIAGAFKLAMLRNNKELKLGRSNDGPVPRFVAAVIPLITGESPTLAAVAQHLKRQPHVS